ncbi:hypothetical protein V2J09_013886 [Rumex salicifolius]
MATQVTMSEDEARVYAMQLTTSVALPMVLKSAIELGLLDIIDNAGPKARLSSANVASLLHVTSPEASSSMIDRILNILAAFSIVTCSLRSESSDGEDGKMTRVYGLAPTGRFFVKGVAFVKAHGTPIFHYVKTKPELGNMFNEAMAGMTKVSMKKLIDVYGGFNGVKVLVDVAGGTGALLNVIIQKYPKIKGVNLDLPQVISTAPSYAGIQHVGGNMFEKVPNGDAIMLRGTIHDWDDESCVKILEKCYEALEEGGKVIIFDSMLPVSANSSDECKYASQLDVLMMTVHGGGKERTEEEFRAISKAAGFKSFEIACSVNANSVIELRK